MKANLTKNPDLIQILINGLRQRIVEIDFTKKDGNPRRILATLNQSVIPEEHLPIGNNLEQTPDDQKTFVRVYDTENEGWRTVIFDSVTAFGPA